MAESGTNVWLRVPPDTFYLGMIRKMVADLARRIGFSPGDLTKIEMAVDEACTSVIQQTRQRNAEVRQDDPEQELHLSVGVTSDRIEITLRSKDQPGLGRQQLSHAQSAASPEEFLARMDLDALGIYLVRNFMDEVDFKSDPEQGNQLRLVKYLRSSAIDVSG